MFSKKFLILVFSISLQPLLAVDNPHTYKTPYLNASKSFKTKKWLSSIDMQYAQGSTKNGWNDKRKKVGAFDIYGNHNLLYLTANVTQPASLSTEIQNYVNTLDTKRTSFETDNPSDKQTFGLVEFTGKCSVDEFVFNYRQNLVYKFFLETNIPVRRIKTSPLCIVDKSPVGTDSATDYTQKDSAWIDFRDNFNNILQEYGFNSYLLSHETIELGDTSLLVGWQHTFYFPVELLDYITWSIKAGVMFPTSSVRSHNNPFSFSTGYNNHYGIPVRADKLFGISPDIYFGTYMGAIFFLPKTFEQYPVKTNDKQNGFIKLHKTKVKEKKGILFDVGGYLKLDHFLKGLSALAGYSFTMQGKDKLFLSQNCEETNETIINTDSRLKSWYQHVLHFIIEYDFSTHTSCKHKHLQPRISIFYDHPFDGKRALNNTMIGGSFGFDIHWNF